MNHLVQLDAGKPVAAKNARQEDKNSPKHRWRQRLAFGYLALTGSVILLFFCEVVPSWYSAGLPHRTQTDAFLRGQLALSHNPAELGLATYDLCWSEGGVHQVWGLGIPLWRLPFEVLARLLGQPAFPDRIALALFMALVAYVVLKSWSGASLAQNRERLDTGRAASGRTLASFLSLSQREMVKSEDGALGIENPVTTEPGRIVSAHAPVHEQVTAGISPSHPRCQSELSSATGFPEADRRNACPTLKWTQSVVGFGAAVFCLLFAPLVNLLRSPMNHYEEVLVYVHFFGIALACGVMALARSPKWGRYGWLCVLAGLGGLIRPTLVFYGAATVVVASLTMICGRGGNRERGVPETRRWSWVILGVFLFALGGGLLFATNLFRFGSGWEFGHSLNLSPALSLLYMERFDSPFAHVSLVEAAREMFGAMFLTSKFNGVSWYDQGLFPGQSETIRWRMIDFTTYDLSYAMLLAIAWSIAAWLVWKWLRSLEQPFEKLRRGGCGLPPSCAVLTMWSLLVSVPLMLFYLRVPVLASRYMLDFSPAFAASLVGLWWWTTERITRRKPRSVWMIPGLCAALISWQGWEISQGKSGFGSPHSITQEELLARMDPQPHITKQLPNEYRIGDPMKSWGIPYNGEGWGENDGHVWSFAIFFVESPEFLELELVAAPGDHKQSVSIMDIRAKVGLEFLDRVSVTQTNNEWIVRFASPKQRRYQNSLQPVFMATVPYQELANYVIPPSPWILKRISWRHSVSK